MGLRSISIAITLGANPTRAHLDLWAFIISIVIAVTQFADSIIFASPLTSFALVHRIAKNRWTSAAVLMIAANTSAFVDIPTLRGY